MESTSSQGAAEFSQTDSAFKSSDRASDTDSLHMTRNDTDSNRGDTEEENEGNTGLKLTRRWLVDFFKKEWRQYYRTMELNEKLYLHYKGFGAIRCMELFPDLKCLYFEGNGITEIRGLDTNTLLMSLMLQENLIRKVENLHTLSNLRTLNLSENCIRRVEGLEGCV